MSVTYCGLDLGSTVCHVTAKSLSGEVLFAAEIPTNEKAIRAMVKRIRGEELHFLLEAGELTGWVRRVLLSCSRVKRVLVSNPKRTAWIAKDSHKSDSVDSSKLADLLRMGMVEKHQVFYPDDAQFAMFKQVVQLYEKMTRDQARTKMRIKAFLRTQGVIATGDSVYSEKGREEYIQRLPQLAARDAARQLYSAMDAFIDVQESSKKLMLREAKRYPQIPRYDRVPGIGPVNACRFVAYVQDPHRFRTKRQLWSYARLGICHRSSNGETIGRIALDWNGNGTLKDVARKTFNTSLTCHEDNLFQRSYRASLRRTGSESHARLNTMRKILAVLLAMWKEESEYRDDKG